jgi:hypothetical protein
MAEDFAAILERILRADAPDSPRETGSPVTEAPTLVDWDGPAIGRQRPLNLAYPPSEKIASKTGFTSPVTSAASTSPITPPKHKQDPPPERKIYGLAFNKLTADETRSARELFKLAGMTIPALLKESEIRKVFRNIAKLHHPDGKPGAKPEEIATMARVFAIANRNYKMILKAVRGRGELV